MVNYCVCAGCNNTNRTGYRVHDFPKDKAILKRWVQFVKFRRADFSMTSVTRNAKICSAHFREEDYDPGDIRMASLGLKRPKQVRLIPTAVPSVHTHLSACPAPRPRSTKVRAARRKRELATTWADASLQETAVQVNLKPMMVSVGTQTTFGMQTSTPLASPELTDDEKDPCVISDSSWVPGDQMPEEEELCEVEPSQTYDLNQCRHIEPKHRKNQPFVR
ncbi:hypothetical protein ACEWY4_003996 [Coilia grayii]|uniref:THAP-type domain-containing protein n=1 Tax=Coilia grayii TaxID=363190 RepID=A0ABD1KKH1_9TELE